MTSSTVVGAIVSVLAYFSSLEAARSFGAWSLGSFRGTLTPRSRVRTTSLSRSLTQTGDFAAIVASHDLELVLPHADQIWGVGDGTLITGTLHEPTGQTALSTQLAAIPP